MQFYSIVVVGCDRIANHPTHGISFEGRDRISQFPIPDSQFPIPDSRFPTPYSLLPTPYSLTSNHCDNTT
ncbi:MAG: hypothetical protein F6J94_06165 [Moorea sp. SIO1F2]|uniref:hypothetical protein n=1 Tax=unclassified Moorena TaxID=2683338 RepID=UPI0013BDD2FB|nr:MULTISPECIES: hypothetical protein [unclassified Moorena]NEP23447.1 hypothetical protein [Moorena sp. SIO3I6]NET81554.1 hypothetical protein [Moorena sp. SIO1F2]